MADPVNDKLAGLVRDIDKHPDPLHVDVTPAVVQLIAIGLPAVAAVLELLDAPDVLTRRRAQRVVEGVVMQRHGWRPGRGYADPQAGQLKVRAVLETNGSYRADAPPENRRLAIARWRKWIEEQDNTDQQGAS